MRRVSKRLRPILRITVREKGLVALVAIGLMLLAAILAFFLALYVRQSSTAASVREDALWATYQTDRDTDRLAAALADLIAGRSGADLAEVSRRFDILNSRRAVMEEAPGRFRSDPSLTTASEEFARRLDALLPIFHRLAAEGRGEPGELAAAAVAVEELRRVTDRLLAATNRVRFDMRADDRAETSRIYSWLAAAVVGLTLAMGAVIAVIRRQLRQIEIARLRLQRLSEDLARSAAAAEAGNKAKSAFLATMSHEIRTPLNGIVGTVELMGGGRLDREQTEQLAVIRRCSEGLVGLVDDILDFSKLESGTIDLERRETSLADLVDGVVEMLSPRAEAKGLDLVASCPQRSYATDPTRLRQVLLNLVGNALKFTDHGMVGIRVWEIGRGAAAAVLRFQVEDTGIGIAPDAVGRLFGEFCQADASINRRFGGTGLGLAISRRIVEAMGGSIGVESFEGRGTIFWFEVPVGPATTSEPEARIGAGLAATVTASNARMVPPIERDLASLGVRVEPAWRSGAVADLAFVDAATLERRLANGEAIDRSRTVVFGFGARAHAGAAVAVIEGAVTTRRLSRIVGHRAQGTTPSPTADAAATRPAARFAGRVLVVEDNAVNRQVASGLLVRMGLEVETVVDGLQAVERLTRGGIDLVLMDMQMPVLDGLAATAKIRSGSGPSSRVPIVGLTANAFASDRGDCLAAGMNDFVSKPVTRDRLEAALAAHLPAATPAVDGAAAEAARAAGEPPPLAASRDDDVLDRARRRHLVEEIGAEGVAELTAVFVADGRARVDELRAAHAAADRDRIRAVLHTLTGAAANVGCSGVVATIAAIRAADDFGRPDLVDRLAAALRAAQEALAWENGAEAPRRAA